MRITDFFLVLPTFVLALILAPIILDIVGSDARDLRASGSTLIVIVVVIGMTSWATTARIIRCQILSLKERAFVDRARVIGAGGGHIMRRHILPNVDQPDRRQRRPDVRRRGPHRDDPRVHRPRRSVPAVVGPDPQRRRRPPAPRASGRGGTSSRPAACIVLVVLRSRSSATPSTTSSTRAARAGDEPDRRDRRRRRPDRAGRAERAPRSCRRRATTSGAADAAEIRGRRQWPLPKQADPAAPLLVVEDLRTHFKLDSGTVKAVDGVSASRSTTARRSGSPASPAAARRRPRCRSSGSCRPTRRIRTGSSIKLFGIDLVAEDRATQLRRYRWREIIIVFQGAMNALNPVRRVGDQIAEPIEERLGASRDGRRASARRRAARARRHPAQRAPAPIRTSCRAGCASGR